MHFPRRLSGLVASALAILSSAPGQTAYLPAPGELTLTPLYSYQRARDFYFLGDTRATLPDALEQHTSRLDLDYSPAPGWGFDASLGWSVASYDESALLAPGLNLLKDGKTRRSGIIDTRLGVRRLVLDESATTSELAPTVALRLGVIVPGTYDTGFVNAVGDGAAGAELGLLAAKSFPSTGTALFGDLVCRVHAEDVPDAIEASAGLSQQAGPLVVTLGLRHLESLDGPDILGPGFTSLDSFPAVKEVNTALEFGLGFTVGRIGFGLGYAQTIQGRNTPVKSVFSPGASRSF